MNLKLTLSVGTYDYEKYIFELEAVCNWENEFKYHV